MRRSPVPLRIVAAAALTLAVTVSLALAATASAGRVVFTTVLPRVGTKEIAVRVHAPASFRIRLRVPTQGRARLYLLGDTAPRGGPLMDTRNYACEGTAGSLYCQGAFEPLPAGWYTFRIRWDGPQKANVELTVRW